MRRAARTDDNQAGIVSALRKCGATVQSLAAVGAGVPDLLVGFRGWTLLLEVKDGSKPPSARKLTPDQERWHGGWRGAPVRVVDSVDAALEAVGAKPIPDLCLRCENAKTMGKPLTDPYHCGGKRSDCECPCRTVRKDLRQRADAKATPSLFRPGAK